MKVGFSETSFYIFCYILEPCTEICCDCFLKQNFGRIFFSLLRNIQKALDFSTFHVSYNFWAIIYSQPKKKGYPTSTSRTSRTSRHGEILQVHSVTKKSPHG